MFRSTWIAATSALAFSVSLPLAAFAQEKGSSDEEGDDSPPAVTDSGIRPPATVTKGKPAPFPRVADDEETIYAVQRKAYLVDDRLEVTLMGSFSFTDRFVDAGGPAAAVTYHLAENFALEAFGVYMFPSASALTSELLTDLRLTPEVAKLTQMLWGAGLGAEWSPIYGKVEVFGVSLGNFNFFVNIGAGLGQTRVPCTQGFLLDENEFGVGAKCQSPVAQTDPEFDPRAVVYEPSRLTLMTAFGGGVRFFFTNSLGLKLEFKDWLFAARVYRPGTMEPTQRFTDAIRNNIYVNLGFTYVFGGEE